MQDLPLGGVPLPQRLLQLDVPRNVPRERARLHWHLWEQAVLPLAARHAELVYSPANLAPVASGRNVVVIHDAAALRHPEWYSRSYAAYHRRAIPAVARRARQVVTVSDFSRRELAAVLELDPSSVAVIPNGVDTARFSPEADADAVRAAHRLERPYALVVGSRIARKIPPALSTAGTARTRHAAVPKGSTWKPSGSRSAAHSSSASNWAGLSSIANGSSKNWASMGRWGAAAISSSKSTRSCAACWSTM